MTPEQKQSVFNTVVTHLLTQKQQATQGNGNCAYLSPEGLKCAVGCLIKSELYDPAIEGKIVFQNAVLQVVEESLGFPIDINFLQRLQAIHDDNLPNKWRELLQNFALKYNLQFNPPNE